MQTNTMPHSTNTIEIRVFFMQSTIEGAPAFAYINVDLEPGETVIAESNAMSSMAADLDMAAKFNGGFGSGIGAFAEQRARQALGDELKIGRILHPSPANPRAQRNWSGQVREELIAQGICAKPARRRTAR